MSSGSPLLPVAVLSVYPSNLEELRTLGKLKPGFGSVIGKFRNDYTLAHKHKCKDLSSHSYILTFLSKSQYIYNLGHQCALNIEEFVILEIRHNHLFLQVVCYF